MSASLSIEDQNKAGLLIMEHDFGARILKTSNWEKIIAGGEGFCGAANTDSYRLPKL
jgi:hypothetical protein